MSSSNIMCVCVCAGAIVVPRGRVPASLRRVRRSLRLTLALRKFSRYLLY